ncbi:MAG: DUF1223 domain-containing protein [Ginsengibacter sp.]
MKLNFNFLVAAILFSLSCTNAQQKTPAQSNDSFSPVAVIELFTSQGCSSCPPADALLSKTIADSKKNDQKIYALSFHVDYWNRLGWADPFSDQTYSQRQAGYVSALHLNGAYTPQMIVNGNIEFVGSDQPALNRNVQAALKTNAKVWFSNLKATNNKESIDVEYTLDGDFSNSTINTALISPKEVTEVKRGENGGRTLINENVVRKFSTQNAQKSGAIHLDEGAIKNEDGLLVIIFIQNKNGGIIGASEVSIHL